MWRRQKSEWENQMIEQIFLSLKKESNEEIKKY